MIKPPERDKSAPHRGLEQVFRSYIAYNYAVSQANKGDVWETFRALRQSEHDSTVGSLRIAATGIIEGRYAPAATVLALAAGERVKL